MITTRHPLAVAFCVWALASTALGEEVVRPRADFEAFGIALDRALARVSRPVAGPWLPTGEAVSHGYHLQGYGAVFVSPARLLPVPPPLSAQQTEAARALDQAARRLEEAMKRVDNAELRRRMAETIAAMRQTQAELRGGPARAQSAAPDPADPAALEAELAVQVESLRVEAEQAQGSVERSVAEIERQLRAQLPPLLPPPAAPGAPAFPAAVASPAAPAPPAAPPVPAAPPAAETPGIPVALLPPWRLWFEGEPVDNRSPERVIQDVSAAVVGVLESHGPRLRLLKPEEAVVVAVDFVPRSVRGALGDVVGGSSAGLRSERTLVVRVRKRELEACRDGKLPREELRKRIDFAEY